MTRSKSDSMNSKTKAKKAARIFLGFLLLAAPAAVQAQFSYTPNADGVTATITGYAYGPGSVGPVNIPSETNGLTVVSIGDGAFANLPPPGLLDPPGPDYYPTSATIPGSVTNIGASAFLYCPSLTNVTMAYGVLSIGADAFSQCSSLAGVTLPANLTSIGEGAFSYCPSLAGVTIPAGVTNIGLIPFVDCTNMQAINVDPTNLFYSSVDGVLFDSDQSTLLEYPGGRSGGYAIPGSVTSTGEYAFFDCPNLTSVTIPGSVTNLGDYAFGFCASLTNATIPNSITSIPYYGFYWSGLTSIIIPSSVTNIVGQAFQFCFNLHSVYFRGNAPAVGGWSFFNDTNATAYYLPGTTGWGAFSTNSGLPTAFWLLPNPLILNNGSSLGVQSNGFAFTISWATNVSVVVEACTNLANPVWTALQTNALTGGSFNFSDPQWTNFPGRYYRIRTL